VALKDRGRLSWINAVTVVADANRHTASNRFARYGNRPGSMAESVLQQDLQRLIDRRRANTGTR
jgi:hypothetical protein